VLVKICGITNARDGELALGLGADELGFVFAPSARRIEPEAARAIVEALRSEARVFRAVGVFVNETANAMRDIMAFAGLDLAQVHGDESPEDCAAFDFPWFRALRVDSEAQARALAGVDWGCGRLLADARSASGYGGTGLPIDRWAAAAVRGIARARNVEFFVAGGIGPENVARLARELRPDGIDVSSGVEERPGTKSKEKLTSLFAALKRRGGNEKEFSHARTTR
jgi:phosphoribosylanthranilate isomerase